MPPLKLPAATVSSATVVAVEAAVVVAAVAAEVWSRDGVASGSGTVVVCEERAASAARCRRSNSACWSAGRRGGEGDVWKEEDEEE
jgi:hypothetical protein